MPASFFGAEVGTAPDVWVPLNLQRQLQNASCISQPYCWYLNVMGRLKPGLPDSQAQAELKTISRGIMQDNHPPERVDRKADFLAQVVQIEPGAAGFTGLRLQFRAPLQVLMALVGFVLLIACANMANLLTARAAARRKEVAIRLAMGAGRGRVIRQFLTESLLLSIAGAAGGFLIAIWAERALISLVSSTAVLNLKPDWRVLLFTAVAAIATGVLFGIAPAFRATRTGIGWALKERVHQIRIAEGRFSLTRILLAVQVALSIVLLAAAGLLAGSLVRMLTEGPGFDPRDVTVVALDTTKLSQKGPALLDLYGKIMERAKTLPDVESASLMSTTPLSNSGWDNYIAVPGRPDIPEEQRDTGINTVGPGLLRTMGIPLLAGRDIAESDTSQSQEVAIINESAARRWYPKGALGADLVLRNNDKDHILRIVGIAGDTKYWNLREGIPATMYLPYTQWNQVGYVAMRTKAPVRQTLAMFRDMLRQVAPGTPIRTIKTMEQQMDESLSTERLTAYLSVFFAGLALLLTAVGLYGILAYTVAQRTSEIGIRMALGAQRGSVIWLVIREAMGSAAVGAVTGLAVVAAASKLLVSLLYGVKEHDPATMVLAVAALGLVCAIAAWIPARRASRLDPMTALREE
jgi:predicted permease